MATEARTKNTHPADDIITGVVLSRADIEALAKRQRPIWLLDCDLSGLRGEKLQVPSWTFDNCSMPKANFSGANMDDCHFIRTKMGEAIFRDADLTDAVAEACDFNNTQFYSTTLTDAVFRRCRMIGAIVHGTKSLRLEFEKCLLGNARLTGLSFKKQNLVGLDFRAATLTDCDFTEAVLDSGCSLRDTEFTKCMFKGADIRRADLGRVTVDIARKFKGATISFEHAAHIAMTLGLDVGETL